MTISKDFTPALARKMFAYNPETGALTYKKRHPYMFINHAGITDKQAAHTCRTWNKLHAGSRAGTLDAVSTRRVRIGRYAKSTVSAANLVWFMVYNKWPASFGPTSIVHVNADLSDDRLHNLMTRWDYSLWQQAGSSPKQLLTLVELAAKKQAPWQSQNPPTPPKKFRTLLQKYKQQRNTIQPARLTGHPTITHRKQRRQEADKAVALLLRMAKTHPPFRSTKHYRAEMRKWRRWYKHQKFELGDKANA